MAFTGDEAEKFPLETAAEWTRNYRNSVPSGSIKGHFFGRNILQEILDQSGCKGIRFYYALDEEGVKQLIAVGATEDEFDQYNLTIAEKSRPCPPFCDNNASPLNS